MLCQVAGAIVKNDRGEFLTVVRLKKPEGIAMPSFHLRSTNKIEAEGDIFRRRLQEELGIEAVNIRRLPELLLFHHSCRYDFPRFRESMHEWMIFQVLTWNGQPENRQLEKYKSWQWRAPKEIKSLIVKKHFDLVWTKIWKRINPV